MIFCTASGKHTIFLHRYFLSSAEQNRLNNWIKYEGRAWQLVNRDLCAIGTWQKAAPCSGSWTELRRCCSAAPHHSAPGRSTVSWRWCFIPDWPGLPKTRLECCIFWAQLFCFWFQRWQDTSSCPRAEHTASNGLSARGGMQCLSFYCDLNCPVTAYYNSLHFHKFN